MTVFWSKLRDDVPADYGSLAAELLELAQQVEGFVDYTSLTADNGDHLSIAIFETIEAEARWRENVAHRAAQQRGRDQFYEWYDVSVCEELHRHRWSALPVTAPAAGE